MTVKDYIIFGIGVTALILANVLAIIFDSEWIKVAITLDSTVVGGILARYIGRSE